MNIFLNDGELQVVVRHGVGHVTDLRRLAQLGLSRH